MPGKRLFITTPVGNIGSRVMAQLAQQEAELATIVLADDADQLPDPVRQAADVHVGSMDDAGAMIAASRGASAMFFVLPYLIGVDDLPARWRTFTRIAAEAIEANGIGHVVFISSQGSGPQSGNLLAPLFETESALCAVAPNVRVLRCGFFMENLLAAAPAVPQGALPVAIPASVPLQLVATRDIGDVAAGLLADLSWSGQETLAVYGPQDVTPAQMAETLTGLLGREVQHVPLTTDEFVGALVRAGFSEAVARPTAELYATLADSDFVPDQRTPAGTTATTFEQFARDTLIPVAQQASGA